jgi:carbonic anhydrase/acetyltransferase-like protein (isoleucine patch superfamily)
MPIYALGDLIPRIHEEAYVHPDAVIIGNVTLEAESSVWPTAVLRGDSGAIVIGARTNIQDGVVIHGTRHQTTIIGSRCVVGHNAHLEGCTVGDDTLIGSCSVVLRGAVVGSRALVGAGAVVNRIEVPDGSMALGVPATVTPDAVAPGQFDVSVQRYVDHAVRYRAELRRIDHDVLR